MSEKLDCFLRQMVDTAYKFTKADYIDEGYDWVMVHRCRKVGPLAIRHYDGGPNPDEGVQLEVLGRLFLTINCEIECNVWLHRPVAVDA